MEEFESLVNEKMDDLIPFLEGLEGVKRPLIEDILRDYCGVCVQLDQVRESVIKDGTTLTAVNGNKVKNPDVTTMHSLINEKNALLPKIIKFIADTDTAPVDELAAFNAS